MKTTEDIAAELARRFRNRCQRWLIGDETWPMRLPLGAPTQAAVERDMGAVRRWATDWDQCRRPGRVEMQTRRWGRVGEQTLPATLELAGPLEAAAWAAQAGRFERAQARLGRLVAHWAPHPLTGLEKHFDVLADYSPEDFERLVAVVDWLLANPASGHYLRQLPIAGVHTKWVESRKGLIVRLLAQLRGLPQLERDFERACGLRRKPDTVRMRVLCPTLRSRFSGLGDMSVPLDDLARLELQPAHVLVVENLESGLALSQMPGVVAFMARGWTVDVLGQAPWVAQANLLYWGDIDTHGLAILARLRSVLPQTRSVLMDEATLLGHRELWSTEDKPHAATELSALNDAERDLYAGLCEHRWGQNVRLEQERLAWPAVLAALTEALGRPLSPG